MFVLTAIYKHTVPMELKRVVPTLCYKHTVPTGLKTVYASKYSLTLHLMIFDVQIG